MLWFYKKVAKWNSPEVQWLGLSTFTAVGLGSIWGQGTKIPQAEWHGQKKKKKKVAEKGGVLDSNTSSVALIVGYEEAIVYPTKVEDKWFISHTSRLAVCSQFSHLLATAGLGELKVIDWPIKGWQKMLSQWLNIHTTIPGYRQWHFRRASFMSN